MIFLVPAGSVGGGFAGAHNMQRAAISCEALFPEVGHEAVRLKLPAGKP